MKLFESSRQAPLFLIFACCGILLGIIYDILYIFRRRKKSIALHAADAFFSICFFAFTALCALIYNSGKLEWYYFAGLATGFTLEHFTLGSFIKISIDFFAKILYNLYIKSHLLELFKRIAK